MQIGQDVNNPTQGFTKPFRGVVPTASYVFTVTVNPCVITNVLIGPPVTNLEITVGDA